MAQPTPDHPPDEASDSLHRNIQKTVAVSALRKIRGLVDEYDEEQRLNDRLSRRLLAAGAIVAGGVAVILIFTGGALPRILTALLGWFRG